MVDRAGKGCGYGIVVRHIHRICFNPASGSGKLFLMSCDQFSDVRVQWPALKMWQLGGQESRSDSG